jgi:hypothetical protein
MGDWKIVREKPDTRWQLFNLSKDIGESHNLAAARPEKLDQLEAEFRRWENRFQAF